MRFFALALPFSLTAFVSASVLIRRGYPACANTCLAQPDLGGCTNAQDLDCLCHSSEFITSTSQCFDTACSGSDLQDANETARQACLAVGVTITSVPAPSSTAASGSASAAAAASTTASAPSSSAPAPSSSSSSTSSSGASTASSSALGMHPANFLAGGAVVLGALFAL